MYPRKFVELIGDCIQKEIADAKLRNGTVEKMGVLRSLGVVSQAEFQKSMEALMAAVEKVEPPHEPEGSVRFDELYAGRDFYDDVSGMPLDRKLDTQARKNEIDFFKDRGVYTEVRREPWMKVITTK